MGALQSKDRTAQGVAKVRHMESLYEPSQRLYHDPYAHAMFPGAVVQNWIGTTGLNWMYKIMGMSGLAEILTVRTKWLDDQILLALTTKAQENTNNNIQQLVILGAGYDTRGFRLELPGEVTVFEVDQLDVQSMKRAKLETLAKSDAHIAECLKNESVVFVPVDFNDSESGGVDNHLSQASRFKVGERSTVTLEGVTQYIPKSATTDTLSRLRKVMAPSSKLLITYVDQDVFDDPSKIATNPKNIEKLLWSTNLVGEPWISGWTPSEFQTFLQELGFEVNSDTTASDHYNDYLVPLGRGVDERYDIERLVVATLTAT